MATALAYKFTPAGHEMPEKRRKYEQISSKLQETFEKWMKEDHHQYDDAYSLLSEIRPSIDEAHALVVTRYEDCEPDPAYTLGIFLSAAYNASPEKDIVLDLPVPISKAGTFLRADKRLVAYSPVNAIGTSAAGKVVNFAETTLLKGRERTTTIEVVPAQLFVNYGRVLDTPLKGVIINASKNSDIHQDKEGKRTAEGFYFDIGYAKRKFGTAPLVFEMPRRIQDEQEQRKKHPHLHAHCKRLREIVEEGRQKPFEMLDKLDAARIRHETRRALRLERLL